MIIDSWVDTSCAEKHAHIGSYVEGKLVNTSGFSSSLGSIDDLPIVNVVYTYDCLSGDIILHIISCQKYYISWIVDGGLTP